MNIEKERKFLSEMHPLLREKYLLWKEEMLKVHLPYIITSVSRSILEQIALYVQGRLQLRDVNRFRWLAGLPMINDEKRNIICTWTLNSKHVTNMFDKELNNDSSRAFDFAIISFNGEPIWNIKADLNESSIPDYDEAGLLGEKVGLTWGGRWKTPDKPHFQIEEV